MDQCLLNQFGGEYALATSTIFGRNLVRIFLRKYAGELHVLNRAARLGDCRHTDSRFRFAFNNYDDAGSGIALSEHTSYLGASSSGHFVDGFEAFVFGFASIALKA
jgi:hypothetical protein